MQLEFEFMKDLDQCVCNGKGCACHDLDAIPAENLQEHMFFSICKSDSNPAILLFPQTVFSCMGFSLCWYSSSPDFLKLLTWELPGKMPFPLGIQVFKYPGIQASRYPGENSYS